MGFFEIIAQYYQYFLRGTQTTIVVALFTVFFGAILGCAIALMRLSHVKPLQWFSKLYITIIRGTPMLVQLYIVYYQLDFIPYPQGTLFGVDMQRAIPCMIALSINSAAYIAEIIRAGIQAVDVGQTEAARSCGMTASQAMRYIILPQAFKRIIPPLGNEFIAMLKDSSLVSVIGFEELTRSGQLIISETYGSLEIWTAVAILYLIMTLSITRLVGYIEKRFRISDAR